MPKFSHRHQTLQSLRRSSIHQTLSTPASSVAMARSQASTLNDPKRAIELLRSLVQPLINDEIRRVLQKYTDLYFQPALANAKKNLAIENVSDAILAEVCRSALDCAKEMFHEAKIVGHSMLDKKGLKRKGDLFGSSSLGSSSKKKKKKKQHSQHAEQASMVDKNNRPQTDLILVSKTGKPVRREGPHWEPDRLSSETLFILGSKANKALGFGQTRGRLYIKHPELFKYSGDQEDKEWLAKNQLMSTTGGKAYLMVLDDILDLSQTPDYATHPRQQPNELLGFTIPEFMVTKMRSFVHHVRTDPSTAEDQLVKTGEVQLAKWEKHRKSLIANAANQNGTTYKAAEGWASAPQNHKDVDAATNEVGAPKKEEQEAVPTASSDDTSNTEADQALPKGNSNSNVLSSDLAEILPTSSQPNAGVDAHEAEKVEAIFNEIKQDEAAGVTEEDLGSFLHNMNLTHLIREFELDAAAVTGNAGNNLGSFLSALTEDATGEGQFPDLTAPSDIKEEEEEHEATSATAQDNNALKPPHSERQNEAANSSIDYNNTTAASSETSQ